MLVGGAQVTFTMRLSKSRLMERKNGVIDEHDLRTQPPRCHAPISSSNNVLAY